jgi:hypothetical protein
MWRKKSKISMISEVFLLILIELTEQAVGFYQADW